MPEHSSCCPERPRALGLIVDCGVAGHSFCNAVDAAFRRLTGSDQNAPYVSITCNIEPGLLERRFGSKLLKEMTDVVRKLRAARAERLAFGNLSWYRFAPGISREFALPLLHPCDALAEELQMRNPVSGTCVGILAQWTALQSKPLQNKLADLGLQTVSLRPPQGRELQRALADLRRRVGARAELRRTILRLVQSLRAAGADEIVIGSAELTGVLTPEELESEFLNLPALHAEAAARWMLSEELTRQP